MNKINTALNGCTFFKISDEEWKTLEVGTFLTLERDLENPYDGQAVKVKHHDKQIAWVPKPENQEISRAIDHKANVECIITRVFGNPQDRPRIEADFSW